MVRKSSSEAASSRVRASTLSNSRTFSIAIAAWSANVVTSSICLSVNGRDCDASETKTPSAIALTHHRTARTVRKPPKRCALDQGVFRIGIYVADMDDLASTARVQTPSPAGAHRNIFDIR